MERYDDHTVAHAIQAKYEKTKICLWPGPMKGGMSVAGRTVETVLYFAGFSNVKSKIIGSRNPLNIETPKDVQQKFGWTMVESYLLYPCDLFGGGEAKQSLCRLWGGKTKEAMPGPAMRGLLYLFWRFCEPAVRTSTHVMGGRELVD